MPIDTTMPAIKPPTALEYLQDEETKNGAIQAPAPMNATSVAPPPQAPQPSYTPDPQARTMGESFAPDLAGFSRDVLQNPSRWDMGMVKDATSFIDTDLKRGQQEQLRGLDEFASQRGLVGSNVEFDAHADTAEAFEQQRLQRLNELNMALAQTLGQDRQAAASIGLQSADFMRSLGLDRENAARYGAEYQRLTGRDLEDDVRFRAGFGLDANNQAFGQGLASAQFQEGQRQFGAGLAQRENEFARSFGLEERQFAEQSKQFSQSMAEEIAGRLQQESQFARALSSDDAHFAIETGLRTRALDLQQQGMSLDDAYRYAAMDVDKTLRTRALDLQQLGMNQEDAYRYAALEQDSLFQQRAQELQQWGMTLDDSYRRAALDFQAWNAKTGFDMQSRQIGDTSRLSYLDILLRAMTANGGKLDLSNPEVAKALGMMGGLGDPSFYNPGGATWFQYPVPTAPNPPPGYGNPVARPPYTPPPTGGTPPPGGTTPGSTPTTRPYTGGLVTGGYGSGPPAGFTRIPVPMPGGGMQYYDFPSGPQAFGLPVTPPTTSGDRFYSGPLLNSGTQPTSGGTSFGSLFSSALGGSSYSGTNPLLGALSSQGYMVNEQNGNTYVIDPRTGSLASSGGGYFSPSEEEIQAALAATYTALQGIPGINVDDKMAVQEFNLRNANLPDYQTKLAEFMQQLGGERLTVEQQEPVSFSGSATSPLNTGGQTDYNAWRAQLPSTEYNSLAQSLQYFNGFIDSPLQWYDMSEAQRESMLKNYFYSYNAQPYQMGGAQSFTV